MPTAIQRALISVSDKTGLIPFSQALTSRGIEIYSTGGTYQALRHANIPAIEISEYTQFPEMMDGRVKTLHPKIFGGILGRRDIDGDVMQANGILNFDLIVINLYPFEKTIQKEHCSLEEAIENIDIGGPSLIRAAAKNHHWTAVVVDINDYDKILTNMCEHQNSVTSEYRLELAAKAFAHTARYDGIIADHLGHYQSPQDKKAHSQYMHCQFELDRALRYGENPQQASAFYKEKTDNQTILSQAELIQGKPLSFNNIVDVSCAMECCYPLKEPSCVIVKHANPCAVASADHLTKAYQKAFACDSTSSFGGIIAFNKTVDHLTIEAILNNQFVEAICAPGYTTQAIQTMQRKPNVRLLSTGSNELHHHNIMPDFKRIRGGLLTQTWDEINVETKDCEVVTKVAPSEEQWQDLMFAWSVAKWVKSNAIVMAKDNQTIAIGAGQMSRVFSVEIAALKAKQADLSLKGCALASDGFFPFKDNIELCYQMGVKAIIQPGGSMRDTEVIQACNNYGIAMVFTGIRHFRH